MSSNVKIDAVVRPTLTLHIYYATLIFFVVENSPFLAVFYKKFKIFFLFLFLKDQFIDL